MAAILAAAYAAAGAAVLYSRPAGAHGRFTLSASASAVSKAQAARRVVAFLAAENYVQAYALYSGRILGDAQAVSVFRAALDAYLDELLVEYRAGAAPQKKWTRRWPCWRAMCSTATASPGQAGAFTDPSYTPAEPDTPVTLGMIGVSILPQQSNFSDPDLRLVPFGYADPPPNLATDRAVFPEIAVNRISNYALQLRFNVGCPAFAADGMDEIIFTTDNTQQRFPISWYEKQTSEQDGSLYGWVQFQHPMNGDSRHGDRPELYCEDMMEDIRAGSPLTVRFSGGGSFRGAYGLPAGAAGYARFLRYLSAADSGRSASGGAVRAQIYAVGSPAHGGELRVWTNVNAGETAGGAAHGLPRRFWPRCSARASGSRSAGRRGIRPRRPNPPCTTAATARWNRRSPIFRNYWMRGTTARPARCIRVRSGWTQKAARRRRPFCRAGAVCKSACLCKRRSGRVRAAGGISAWAGRLGISPAVAANDDGLYGGFTALKNGYVLDCVVWLSGVRAEDETDLAAAVQALLADLEPAYLSQAADEAERQMNTGDFERTLEILNMRVSYYPEADLSQVRARVGARLAEAALEQGGHLMADGAWTDAADLYACSLAYDADGRVAAAQRRAREAVCADLRPRRGAGSGGRMDKGDTALPRGPRV